MSLIKLTNDVKIDPNICFPGINLDDVLLTGSNSGYNVHTYYTATKCCYFMAWAYDRNYITLNSKVRINWNNGQGGAGDCCCIPLIPGDTIDILNTNGSTEYRCYGLKSS